MTGTQIDSIREWVESSGRALELRTVRAFRDHTNDVNQSVRYEGLTDEREIDVVAEFKARAQVPEAEPGGERQTELVVQVYVECKTARPGTAWVGFMDPGVSFRHRSEAANNLYFLSGHDQKAVDRFRERWADEAPFSELETVSHVADAFIGEEARKSKRESSWDAIRQSISGARAGTNAQGGRVDYHRRAANPATNPRTALGLMAMIVTTVPLYLCELDAGNEVIVREADAYGVRIRSFGEDNMTRLLVVHETTLPRILSELRRVTRSLSR